MARVVAQSPLLTAPTHAHGHGHGHAPSKEIRSLKMACGLETPLLRIRSDSISLSNKLVRFGHDFRSPVTLSSRPVAKEARFEGFTGKALEALMIARDESERLGHKCIELGHILLGLIGVGTGIAAECLKSIGIKLGIKLEDVREYAIESLIGVVMGPVSVLWFLFSPTAMDTLILSFEEARKLGHNYIGPEHLFLGLLRHDSAREGAPGVLEFLGFDLSNIRTEVLRMVGEGDNVSVVPEGSTSNAKVATLEGYGANLMQCIGATTLDDYNQHSVEGTIAILMGLKEHYEIHHNLRYEDQAVITVAELSNQFISDGFLPDKAIDLFDKAGAHVSTRHAEFRELRNREMELRLQFHILHKMSQVDKDEAMKDVSFCAYNDLSRFCISHPIASFIFYGPTGVGKSELAKALAANYFGSEEAVTQFDMTEFMGSHTLSKLIGSSSGHTEGGQLTDAVRRQPHTVVLFKEIEKAHTDVLSMIRWIFIDGFLADGNGRIVDFRNTLMIMTSNAGSSVIEKGE
ncbi:hypothetical protein V6N12_072231 [Hibiscus sabdariffa]|uniref:Clp R domain-containing protein n=1 Tax=Hibiscus sabdariffa TaxID=183260 RepID=A0ABR2FM57_9ROSI